jgi:hypothetical protein
VKSFLTAQGLTVLAVAENNMYVKVQGTVGAIEKTFHVQINSYKFKGNTYRSNKADPSVNDPAGKYIAAITGMDDLGFQPAFTWASAAEKSLFRLLHSAKLPTVCFSRGRLFDLPKRIRLPAEATPQLILAIGTGLTSPIPPSAIFRRRDLHPAKFGLLTA